jgi:S1-C subfamily serine protease
MTDRQEISRNHQLAETVTTVVLPSALLLAMLGAFGIGGYYLGVQQHERRATEGSEAINAPLRPASTATCQVNFGEHTISDIVKKTAPSVVSIDVSADQLPAKAAAAKACPGQDYFYGKGMSPHRNRYEHNSSASGLVYSKDGYIITCSHVIKDADKVKVILSDKSAYKAQVIGQDTYSDIALLKINAENLPVVKLGDSSHVSAGDWAIAIGTPMRLENTVSLGIISATGRSIDDPGARAELIQTDAAINPGNSGGPLINVQGEVIGITTAVQRFAQNIAFAVPTRTVKKVVEQLKKEGKVQRAFLGIHMEEIDRALFGDADKIDLTDGVLVTNVYANSPASKAHMEVGDIIKKMDNIPVHKVSDLRRILERHFPGDKVDFVVQRPEGEVTCNVQVEQNPNP